MGMTLDLHDGAAWAGPAAQKELAELLDEHDRLRKALRWHIRVYRVADEAWDPEAETDRLMAKALEVPNA